MGIEKEMDGCTWKMKEVKMVEVSSSGGSRDFVGDSEKEMDGCTTYYPKKRKVEHLIT